MVESSKWDPPNEPLNLLLPDLRRHFLSKVTDGRFVALQFISFKVRPSAVCLRSWYSHNFHKIMDPMRSFALIGSKTLDRNGPKTILGIFNYTQELKEDKGCIYYINTDEYFHKIYIQQLDRSFDKNACMCLSQIEVHGLIEVVDP